MDKQGVVTTLFVRHNPPSRDDADREVLKSSGKATAKVDSYPVPVSARPWAERQLAEGALDAGLPLDWVPELRAPAALVPTLLQTDATKQLHAALGAEPGGIQLTAAAVAAAAATIEGADAPQPGLSPAAGGSAILAAARGGWLATGQLVHLLSELEQHGLPLSMALPRKPPGAPASRAHARALWPGKCWQQARRLPARFTLMCPRAHPATAASSLALPFLPCSRLGVPLLEERQAAGARRL
jgi:hypothetical protein